ncbi:hypothetical protein [Hymenobacter sp. CRA2]|uniref:hypothetical protein n=1 Tax=Hymenobacter sp. CRA2 TaxID=1955620 RepID=UPI00098FCC65|nr:hypothetical protein [Hymenobacter sp. CRA2]OON69028.1 hypothetical protein B0919_09955 [Hymenobacter sp. CRA2]
MKWLFKALLAAAPRLLWWALAALVLAALNLLAREEIWPNTPAAEPACQVLLAASVIGLLLTGPWTLWRLADALPWAVLRLGARVAAVLAGLVALPVVLFALGALIVTGSKMIGAG